MYVNITTPSHILFEGEEIKLVQLPGINGSFEIMHNHAPLVSLLQKGTIRLVNQSNQKFLFKIKDGFVKVADNSVLILENEDE